MKCILLLLILALAGCGPAPSEKAGALRAERDVELIAAAEAAVRFRLKDPDSATFSNTRLAGAKTVCGDVESPNGYQGYAGTQSFLYRRGATFIGDEAVDPSYLNADGSSPCD